jgi:hypothetical protein
MPPGIPVVRYGRKRRLIKSRKLTKLSLISASFGFVPIHNLSVVDWNRGTNYRGIKKHYEEMVE